MVSPPSLLAHQQPMNGVSIWIQYRKRNDGSVEIEDYYSTNSFIIWKTARIENTHMVTMAALTLPLPTWE